jgi:alkaline phosphatase D
MKAFLTTVTLILTLISCKEKGQTYPILMEQQKLAIMQSGTSATETIISVLAPTYVPIEFQVTNLGKQLDLQKHLRTQKKSMFDSVWSQYHLFLKDLDPQKNYKLIVKSKDGKWDDERDFTTLDFKKRSDVRFAVTSCSSDVFNSVGNVMWPQLVEDKPEVIFMIGDNIYADVYQGVYLGVPATPQHLWKRHVETRNKLAIFRNKKLIPVYAIWDDHDYGANNSNSSYQYKDESKKNI